MHAILQAKIKGKESNYTYYNSCKQLMFAQINPALFATATQNMSKISWDYKVLEGLHH